VSALERLSDQEVLALARFILRHVAKSGNFHWRTRFVECGRRGWFAPAAERGDESTLTSLYERHGSAVLCELRTREVLTAANELSAGGGPVTLSGVPDLKTSRTAASLDGVSGSLGGS